MEQFFLHKLTELLLLKIDYIKSKLLHFQFENIQQCKNVFKFKYKRITCVCIIHNTYPDTIFMIGSNHENGVYIRKCATYGGIVQ